MTWNSKPQLVTLTGKDTTGEQGRNKFYVLASTTGPQVQADVALMQLLSNAGINTINYNFDQFQVPQTQPSGNVYSPIQTKAVLSILWSDGVTRKFEIMAPKQNLFFTADPDQVDINALPLLNWFGDWKTFAIQIGGATPVSITDGKLEMVHRKS
jgi:hypothetical protein